MRMLRGPIRDRLVQLKPPRSVPMRRLLVGQQAGTPAQEWFRRTGDATRFSMLLQDSPYLEFLRAADSDRALLRDPDALRRTSYYRMAACCLAHTGEFFEATTPDGILAWMRRYYELYTNFDRGSAAMQRGRGHSHGGTLPVVTAVRDSDVFEIVDGHHRLAVLLARGAERASVIVNGRKHTFLQEELLRVQQTHGVELYQPVPRPEVETWRLVRRCEDRFARIQSFLEERRLAHTGADVLDCGCSYGWFVSEFKKRGYRARGLDRDPRATRIGELVYGLEPGDFVHLPLEEFLESHDGTLDVVLCLSLLHHYAIGKERGAPEAILKALGRITGKVLFLDTGQSSEGWLRRDLHGWDAGSIQEFLARNGGFTEVVDLGPDADNVGRFREQYGRTLFACLKG
jgi:SAM-dependent methyltransferase